MAVMGAGSIGTYFGGWLAAAADVTLIGVRASTERPGVGAMTQIVSQQVDVEDWGPMGDVTVD